MLANLERQLTGMLVAAIVLIAAALAPSSAGAHAGHGHAGLDAPAATLMAAHHAATAHHVAAAETTSRSTLSTDAAHAAGAGCGALCCGAGMACCIAAVLPALLGVVPPVASGRPLPLPKGPAYAGIDPEAPAKPPKAAG